jgi:hypothetical protein
VPKAARIILSAIAGALVGLLLYAIGTYVMAEGYLVPWQKLAAPPVRLDELVLSTPSTVYGRAADGTTYRCSDWQDGCWVQDEIPEGFPVAYITQNTKACDLSRTAFRWLRVAPSTVVDCIQGAQIRIDCHYEFTYVLDRKGDVWGWVHEDCADGVRFWLSVFVVGFGGALGLAVGTLVALARGEWGL